MLEEQIAQILNTVMEEYPRMHAILKRQVAAQAISQLIWALILLGFTFVGYVKRKEIWKRLPPTHDHLGPEPGGVLTRTLLFTVWGIALLVGLDLSIGAMMRMINPDYYAIRLLLQHF